MSSVMANKKIENQFKSCLNMLINLNKTIEKKFLSLQEQKREEKNLHDLEELFKTSQSLIDKLQNSKNKTRDELAEELVMLHLQFSNLIWHCEQIHELIRKALCALPEPED